MGSGSQPLLAAGHMSPFFLDSRHQETGVYPLTCLVCGKDTHIEINPSLSSPVTTVQYITMKHGEIVQILSVSNTGQNCLIHENTKRTTAANFLGPVVESLHYIRHDREAEYNNAEKLTVQHKTKIELSNQILLCQRPMITISVTPSPYTL